MVCLSDGEKIEDMFIRFDRINERDSQWTNKQTDEHRMTAFFIIVYFIMYMRLHSVRNKLYIYRPRLCIALRAAIMLDNI